MHRPHFMSGGRYPVLRSLAILYLIAGVVMALFARMGMKKEPPTVFRRIYEEEPGVRRYW